MEIEIDLPLYNSIVASVTDSLVQRQTKAVEQLSNLRSWLDSHEQLDALQQAKELHELEERHRLQIEAVKRMHSDSRQTNTVIYQTLTQSFEAQLRNYATELATWSGKVNPNLPTFQPLLIQSRASAPVAGADEEFRYLPTGDQTERADGGFANRLEPAPPDVHNNEQTFELVQPAEENDASEQISTKTGRRRRILRSESSKEEAAIPRANLAACRNESDSNFENLLAVPTQQQSDSLRVSARKKMQPDRYSSIPERVWDAEEAESGEDICDYIGQHLDKYMWPDFHHLVTTKQALLCGSEADMQHLLLNDGFFRKACVKLRDAWRRGLEREPTSELESAVDRLILEARNQQIGTFRVERILPSIKGVCAACQLTRTLSLRIYPNGDNAAIFKECGSECGPLLEGVYEFVAALRLLIAELQLELAPRILVNERCTYYWRLIRNSFLTIEDGYDAIQKKYGK